MGKLFNFVKKNGPFFIFCVTLVLGLTGFFELRKEAVKELQVRFDRDASIRINEIFGSIELGVAQLNLLQSFFESSEEVTPAEFSRFALQFLDDNAVSAIAFAPIVPLSFRSKYEADAAKITKKATVVTGVRENESPNSLIAPVMYVEPADDFGANYGKNMMFERSRANAIEECMKTGKTAISAPLTLLPEVADLPGFILVRQVKLKKDPHAKGLVIAAFSAADLMSESINRTPILNIHTTLYEKENGGFDKLGDWEPRLPDAGAGFMPLYFLYPKNVRYESVQQVAGRDFKVVTYPGRVYLKNNFRLAFTFIAPLTLLLAVLFYLYLRNLVERMELAERKAFENSEEFIKKARELQQFFDLSINLLCIADTSGRFLRVSKSWGRLLGYEIKELEGKRFFDYVHPDDMEATLRAVKQLENSIDVTGFVNRYRNRDGTYKWLEWRSSAEKGIIYASAADITDRLKKETELRESEEKFRIAFKTSPDAIALNRLADGKYLMINDGFTAATGFLPEEVVGKTSKEIDIWADYSDREKLLAQLSAKGFANNMEFKFRLKDGSIRIGLMSAKIITVGGDKDIMVTVRDIHDRKMLEEKVKEQELMLRESQEAGRIGAYSLDLKSGRFTTSHVLEEILGIDENYPHTIDGWYALIHPEHKVLIGNLLSGLTKHQNTFERVYLIIRHATGEHRWVLGRGRVDFAADGTPEKMVGTLQDVNDIELARRALAESQELYSNIVETAHDLIWRIDTKGRYVFVNKAFEPVFGYRTEEMIGKPYTDFMDLKTVRQQVESFGRELREKGHAYGFEVLCRRKDGKELHLLFNAKAIYDKQGNLTGAQGTSQDITEQRVAESKIKSLFLGMAEGVALHEYETGSDGKPCNYRIVDINPQYEKIIGVMREAVIGKLATEAYGLKDPPYLKEFSAPFETGGFTYFETYFKPMDKYFYISVSPWGSNGFATIFSDISVRKRHEQEREKFIRELEEKNAEMERFIYTVSHDLKNPLLTISGFTGLLNEHCEKGAAADIKNDLGFISNAASAMKRLLDDVLQISRIGRVVNAPEKVYFAEMVKDTLNLLAGDIKIYGAQIILTDAAAEMTAANEIFVDRRRYVEVLQNLVVNGIKFAKKGQKPVIEIGVKEMYNGFKRVYYVKDNGIGINPKYSSKIFGLFERLDQSVEGTGIGLPIVKRIVELHGGRVWMESEGEGKGSVFYFTIGSGV